tara:strand:+ start:1631 stop:2356 length:726 start_codon:yes stop_codon:yes gene_type:complete
MIDSLSIILPVFNEEKRLVKTFAHINKYLKKKQIKLLEFIFVNDGSTDKSKKLLLNFLTKKRKANVKISIINLKKNIGKGGALKAGVKKAKYNWILTSDIDFSVPLSEIEKWQRKKYIHNQKNVYFGSRSHKNSKVESKFYRKFVGHCLSIFISLFLGINIKDTQCGFKLYRNSIAKKIFSQLRFLNYEHDIEIVLILKNKKIKVIELPIIWNHVPNSKVNILIDSLKIFIKILLIKIRYN